jgi:hypothetical protein
MTSHTIACRHIPVPLRPCMVQVQIRVRPFRLKNFFACKRNEAKLDPYRMYLACSLEKSWAAIHRRGSLAWTVILSVSGADTIAIDLSISALIS